MTDLLQLAERCEKATGPDRELDEAIEKSLPCSRRFAENNPHAPPTQWNERGAAFHGARIGDCDNFDEYVSPPYTASIDAAMSLVPEGWFVTVMNARDDNGRPRVGAGLALIADVSEPGNLADAEPCEAATPALALCAAALRAKANGETA